MSHYMTALAMKQQGLKPAAKIVLYWLADHYNESTGACFPSLKTLAAECEMDVASIKRHLANLEASRLIQRTQRLRENGSQTSTQYTLHLMEAPAQNAPAPSAKCATPLAQNDTPHNLGIYNLGNEQDISPPCVFLAYNKIAERVGWPKVQKHDKARERAAAARIKDCGGFGNWRQCLERAAQSDFLAGRATGTTPASFDWINKAANFAKIMEGNYDNRNHNGAAGRTHAGSDRPGAGMAQAFAAVAERLSRHPEEGDCFGEGFI